MRINDRTRQDIFFILLIIGISVCFGIVLSAYHCVCTRTFDHFLFRPLVGLVCGFLASTIHVILVRIINAATRGAYENRTIFQVLQLTFIAYCCLLGAEFTFFQSRLHEPSHKFWILGFTIFAFVLSVLVFLYYMLLKMITTQLKILEKLHLGLLESLITVLEVREPYKAGHSKRVSEGCEVLAGKMGLERPFIEKLKRAAMMHDLGKILIDDRFLHEDVHLNQEELAEVRLHPLRAEKILAPLNILSWETDIIKKSHFIIDLVNLKQKRESERESLDSSIETLLEYTVGGEKLEDMPLEARILSAVDFFDTLTHPRPHRKILSRQEVLTEMRAETGRQLDSEVVEALSDCLDKDEWPPDISDRVVDKAPPEEEEILKEVRKTATGLNFLALFFKFMGLRRHRVIRSIVLAMVTGLVLGCTLGLSLYASTSQSQWIFIFFSLGVISGVVGFSVGYLIEYKVLPRYLPETFFGKSLSAGIGYFVSGVLASLITLFVLVYPAQHIRNGFDIFGLVFVVTGALLSGCLAVFYRYYQESTFRMLQDQERLQNAYSDLLFALSFALEAKDPYTRGHSEKVSVLALKMGRELKLSPSQLEELEKAALFHDIGKLGISQTIINKASQLSEEELAVIRTHPAIGAEILQPVKRWEGLPLLVKAHHENYDGGGYPEKKDHDRIPLFSRIISIADTYDAMVSDRAYRKGLPHDMAVAELRRCAGTQFDPDLVDLFIKAFEPSTP